MGAMLAQRGLQMDYHLGLLTREEWFTIRNLLRASGEANSVLAVKADNFAASDGAPLEEHVDAAWKIPDAAFHRLHVAAEIGDITAEQLAEWERLENHVKV